MSDKVEKSTEALVHAILESEEYKSYRKYEEELTQKPELKERINEFRIRNFNMQRQEGIDLFEAVDQLEREYGQLRKDSFANAYLESELSLCKMLQNVQKALSENLSISIPEEV